MVPYPKEISQAVSSELDLSVIFYHHHEKSLDHAKKFSSLDKSGSDASLVFLAYLGYIMAKDTKVSRWIP